MKQENNYKTILTNDKNLRLEELELVHKVQITKQKQETKNKQLETLNLNEQIEELERRNKELIKERAVLDKKNEDI
jgi:hypothetical protein